MMRNISSPASDSPDAQIKGIQIKDRGEGGERSIQAAQHEEALTHRQPPAATVASDPRLGSRSVLGNLEDQRSG